MRAAAAQRAEGADEALRAQGGAQPEAAPLALQDSCGRGHREHHVPGRKLQQRHGRHNHHHNVLLFLVFLLTPLSQPQLQQLQ